MADPKGKPKKPTDEAFKDVSIGQDGVYRVTEAASAAAAEAAKPAAPPPQPSEAPTPRDSAPEKTASGKPTPGKTMTEKPVTSTTASGGASSSSSPSSSSAPPPSSGGSSGGGMKTALTAVGALVAGALLAFWVGPKLTGAAETERKVNDLGQRVALFDQQTNALNEAAGRVDALDARVEAMAGGLGALEGSVAGLPRTDEAGPRIAALTERLDSLETALSALSEQQAAVVRSVNEAAAAPARPSEETTAQLGEIESRLAQLGESGAARASAVDEKLAALAEPRLPAEADSRIGALEARLESLTGQIAAALANGGGEETPAAPSAESLRAASDAAAALAGIQRLETRFGNFDGAALRTELQGEIAEARARAEAAEASVGARPSVSPEELAALSARLDELAARQEAAAEAPEPEAPAAPALSAADLEGFGFASRTDLEALASREDLDALAARFDKVESESASANAVRVEAAAAVAAADLASVASGSAPFATQLANLQRLSGVEPDPALAIYARTGVPTMATLLSGYDAAERAALAAEQAARAREAEALGDKLTGAFSSLVSVRKTAESTGVDTASILARARVRLGEGDLASALTELDLLQAAPREGMASWLQGAQARRNVEQSLGRLRQNLLIAPGAQ
ncbi:hypothetical protein [Neomegalonema sp.]|uniref:COG4223 family protein n=1 Tax=Neomegalonema sp. TaxID=2039713 RepID=UPI0026322A3C|nr:hypothetical protein [Neomegalonema sp.]MDD2869591.1 hypothetical protein [Neomegalonema sp.]